MEDERGMVNLVGPKELGSFVKKMREIMQLSLRDVYEKTGISPSQLSKIERGLVKNPSDETLNKLAYALNVDRYELFFFAGKVYPDMEKEFVESIIEAASSPIKFGDVELSLNVSRKGDTTEPDLKAAIKQYSKQFESDLDESEIEELVKETFAAYQILVRKIRNKKRH
ncbi:helix-turn-helix domain-containing protein [Paenibacillus polymyxa]|uniref:helix-turn-helix domain-containing protein n=1 Tax=Paenibacillus polymyxa TaxID=1406 RepID=UPI0012496655|nr:helix-turn-helix transcriptional regulator [Paenibacillus polymyxa]